MLATYLSELTTLVELNSISFNFVVGPPIAQNEAKEAAVGIDENLISFTNKTISK